MQILAPIIRKITPENEAREQEKEERRVVGYRIVHVFDQSQTDGEPLPEMRAELLEGSLPAHWEQVTKLIADAGFGFQVADSDRLGRSQRHHRLDPAGRDRTRQPPRRSALQDRRP